MCKRKIISVFIIIGLCSLSSCDWGRMWETPAVRSHEKKVPDMPKGTVPFGGGEEIWMKMPAEDILSLVPADDPLVIEQGKTLYFTYCAQCHGPQFDGNGTVGQSFAPLPTNLRSEAVQKSIDGVLFKSLSYGVPNGRQPPLATTIELADRWKIIAFVQSLGVQP